jgi:hypothetical protein
MRQVLPKLRDITFQTSAIMILTSVSTTSITEFLFYFREQYYWK